jgi:hypothetical protein
LKLQLEAQGPTFPLTLTGPSGVLLDGQGVQLKASRSIFGSPLLLGLFGAVVVGTSATWAGLRRQRQLLAAEGNDAAEHHYQLAQQLLDAGAPRFATLHLAAHHARRALHHRPVDPYTRLLLAQLYDHQEQPHKCFCHAKRCHDELARISTSDDAARPQAAYLCARSQAKLGQHKAAIHWLRASVRDDPGRAKQARSDSAFHALWEDPDFQAIINGPIAAHGHFDH